MQDIVLDSKTGGNNKKRRGIVNRILRTLALGLILGLLVSFDFVLYLHSGSALTSQSSLNIPAMTIVGYICASALVLMLLTCFSKPFQAIVFALVCAVLMWGGMNQFLQIERGAYLPAALSPLFGDKLNILNGWSHWIMAILAFMIFYAIAVSLSTRKIFCTAVALAFIILWMFEIPALSRSVTTSASEDYASMETEFAPFNNKTIFLFLPNTRSYAALPDKKEDKSRLLRRVMLGFFEKHGFAFYPNAYLTSDKKEDNLTELLNLLDNNPASDHLVNQVKTDDLWRFSKARKEKLSLKDNQLQDVYKKALYRVSTYQNPNLEICKKNGQYAADRCLTRNSLPFDMNTLSASERRVLLAAQWFQSFDFPSHPLLESALRVVLNKNLIHMLTLPYDKMYTIDSLQTLKSVLQAINEDNGAGTYFVYMDFPEDFYAYNEFCRLKRVAEWNAPIGRNEQMICLWSELGAFMTRLEESDLAKNLTFVIQGIESENGNLKKADLVSKHTTLTAIRLPQGQFGVSKEICRSKDILRNQLFNGMKCQEFQGFPLTDEIQKNIKNQAAENKVTEKQIKKAIKTYGKWMEAWETQAPDILQIPAENPLAKIPQAQRRTEEGELETRTAVEALIHPSVKEPLKEVLPQAVVEEPNLEDVPLEYTPQKEQVEPQKEEVNKNDESSPKEVSKEKKTVKEEAKTEKKEIPEIKVKVKPSSNPKRKIKITTEKSDGSSESVLETTPPATQQIEVQKKTVVIETVPVKTEISVQKQEEQTPPAVSADFLLDDGDEEEEWELDTAKALGVSGEEDKQIVVKVK